MGKRCIVDVCPFGYEDRRFYRIPNPNTNFSWDGKTDLRTRWLEALGIPETRSGHYHNNSNMLAFYIWCKVFFFKPTIKVVCVGFCHRLSDKHLMEFLFLCLSGSKTRLMGLRECRLAQKAPLDSNMRQESCW